MAAYVSRALANETFQIDNYGNWLNSKIKMPSNPWAKRDAWRYEGQFSRFNRFKNAFPGFGIAVGAFTVYLAYEKFVLKDEHHDEHH